MPRTLSLKVRAGNIWGELLLDFPEGYDLTDLEDDMFDLVDKGVPVYESVRSPEIAPYPQRRRRKRRTTRDEE